MNQPAAAALLGLAVVLGRLPAQGQLAMPNALATMPAGYNLQAYDDCGAPGRQSHILQATTHTYTPQEVDADERARSVSWDWKHVDAVYDGLDSRLDYVLAVTYANEAFNNRVQSLWAGSVCLHGPHPLPRPGSERLLFRVPREAIQAGKLALQFRLEAQVNAVVSVVELWAPAPSPRVVRLVDVMGLYHDLDGRVLDLHCDPVPNAMVELRRKGASEVLATRRAANDGAFSFERSLLDGLNPRADLDVVAEVDGVTASVTAAEADVYFRPVRYRPIPVKTAGLPANQLSLDGRWRMRTDGPEAARRSALDSAGWTDLRVPGQWRQQGHDIPQDQPVTLSRAFEVPHSWAGKRVFLRFDAIHAGTRYWVNGRYLGSSENLFTPVEWEVTDAVKAGSSNRIDLEMVVATPSERLSYASGYAFHTLGGIDRSVRLYALPQVHIRDLHLTADLDGEYRNGTLSVRVGLDGADGSDASGLSIRPSLRAPDGSPVELRARAGADATASGVPPVLAWEVANPAKWTAETPRLYRLRLDLMEGGRVLESVERRIGFRKIEVRGSQLYVNGRRVKLAGACHHETDPLTGRADTMRHAERDVSLMKAANLNYIRTSHYPPCQELLDAADRIGMYVEVEAPFCWVGEGEDMALLKQVLTPTSAMVDYHHTHPSVIVWSLANESSFNPLFEVSERLCKDLDPSRPTTFNNPDPKRLCDIANLHYPPMPYADQLPGDPRPVFLGEYAFPVCHEQTDVRIDPGLRELYTAGNAEPDSPWGRACASSYDPAYMRPGVPPGAWTHIVRSDRVIGGAIWAALDEPFYFADGKRAGYAWVHGFWGLIDGWRRPKPEWWLSKLLFSPVWFPQRTVPFSPGQVSVRVPVENRYSFTNVCDLKLSWEAGKRKGTLTADIQPGATGEVTLPVPPDAHPGDTMVLRATDAGGALVNVVGIHLGETPPRPLPAPTAGAPRCQDDGKTVTVTGAGWRLALDRVSLRFSDADAAALLDFPSPHVTQYDSGDLASPYHRPYAVLPDGATRVVEAVNAEQRPEGTEITVRDRFKDFAGSMRWLIDRKGMGRVAYDYIYSGPDMSAREVGIRFLLKPECDEVRWKRWSEWEVFPTDDIGRTAGRARARRDPKYGPGPEGTEPRWAWSLDETEMGTADFRAVKLNIEDAELRAPDGAGLRIYARADAHVRPCLDPAGVRLHVLSECRMGPVILKTGDHIAGEFVVELRAAGRRK